MHTPISYRRLHKDNENIETENFDDIAMFPSSPAALSEVDYVDTWKAMEKLVPSGRVRSIGVSNFNSEQVDRVLAAAKIKPVVNQVECHPNLNQRKLLKFLADRNIILTAYSPLGRPHKAGNNLAINDPKVLDLAKKYNKTPAQIVLRYTVCILPPSIDRLSSSYSFIDNLFFFFLELQHQNGAVVIPKSANKERIHGNIDIFDFSLNDAEMQTIDGLNTNTRLLAFDGARGNKNYPFDLEFWVEQRWSVVTSHQ